VSRLAGGRRITPGERIGGGGEAEIFAVREDRTLALKRYTQPTPERQAKVALMTAKPPATTNGSGGHVFIAWPTEMSFADGGAFEGFVMPRIDSRSATEVFALYNPQSRHQQAPAFTWRYLLRTARNVAIAVRSLHARGYVIGDLNESNVLVTGKALVTIVDCDSMQVKAPDGRVFRSLVGKPEYIAPELVGKNLARTDRTPPSDNFALSVLIYLLLMEGVHPFHGKWTGRGELPPLPDRIKRGLYAHSGDRRLTPPPTSLPFSTLPPELQALFRDAFRSGVKPTARPTPDHWNAALARVDDRLQTCRHNRHHVYGGHLNACPWCERIRRHRLPDPFPGPTTPGSPTPTPRPPTPRPQAPPIPQAPPTWAAPVAPVTAPQVTAPQVTARPVTAPPVTAPPPTRPAAPRRPPRPRQRPSWPRDARRRLPALASTLAGAALLISAVAIALMVALEAEHHWLDKDPRERLSADNAAMDHWGPVVGAGGGVLLVLGAVAISLLSRGLVQLLPSLGPVRAARSRRTLLACVALPLALIGIQYLSPGMPAVRVLVEQQAPDGQLLRSDNFSAARGWTARSAGGRGSVTKGALHLVVKKRQTMLFGTNRALAARVAPGADVRIDLRAGLHKGSRDNVYGVACRYRDHRTYYLAGVSSQGRYRIDKRLGERWTELQPWRPSSVVRPSGMNRIQVTCLGGGNGGPVLVALWVNGERLAQVVDRGRLFRGGPTIDDGSVAVFAGSHDAVPLDVTFDDLAVRELDRDQLPSPRDRSSGSYRG
jgi:serine/threonine protein kinase